MGIRSAGYVKLRCEGCLLFFLAPVGSEESLCMFCQEKPLWEFIRRDRERLKKMLYYEKNREKVLAQDRARRAREKAARTPTPASSQSSTCSATVPQSPPERSAVSTFRGGGR